MKIALCGPAGSGKDFAAEWFAENTPLRYTGGTSTIIAKAIATEDGCTVEEAMAKRIHERKRWYDKGNELRAANPAYLALKCLERGDIVVGIRTEEEFLAARELSLFDIAIWIHREGTADETMRYASKLCDVMIENDGTPEFHRKLSRLARTWGLL